MELCEHGNSFNCQSCEIKYLKYVIEELQSRLEHYEMKYESTGAIFNRRTLLNRIEKYEKALKFYANKDYYEPFRKDEEDRTDAFNFIDLDGGATAKEALKG